MVPRHLTIPLLQPGRDTGIALVSASPRPKLLPTWVKSRPIQHERSMGGHLAAVVFTKKASFRHSAERGWSPYLFWLAAAPCADSWLPLPSGCLFVCDPNKHSVTPATGFPPGL